MKISLIPWEIIWLACLILSVILIIIEVFRQLKARKLGWPKFWLLYVSLAVVVLMPLVLRLTNTRFNPSSTTGAVTHYEQTIPDLQPRIYSEYSLDQLYQASLRAIQSMETYGMAWTITYVQPNTNGVARITALAPSNLFYRQCNRVCRTFVG